MTAECSCDSRLGWAKNLAMSRRRTMSWRDFARKINTEHPFARNFDRPISWPLGQLLTRHTRHRAIRLAAALLAALAAACAPAPDAPPRAGDASSRGGELIVSIRSDPASFNWYTRHDASTYLVTVLTQAGLVRVNRVTDEVEPWLAESWTRSDDSLRYTLKLRRGLAFADGQPFTADDVLFSLAAAYDDKRGSILGDAMRVSGKELRAEAIDAHTVVLTFPGPFGAGLRILDNMPILPKHRLQRALDGDGIGGAWRAGTPPSEITGLGPFVLAEYAAGQQIVFTRNPHFFRKDASGAALPYLDRIVVQVVGDQNAEVLRLEAGQSDMSSAEIRPEDYARLKRAADAGRVQLFDLGVGLEADSLWFNLKPGAFDGDPRAPWIQRDELRRAISLAVDRQLFADTVFFGAAAPVSAPITPGNTQWHSPDPPVVPHDPARARALLATIGLTDRNGDGLLEDAASRPARFTLMTAKGQAGYERGVAVIQSELRKIGLTVDLAILEANALIQRFGGKYDAVYFRLTFSDTDPALTPDFWLSGGGSHIWNPGQAAPATAWERELDDLMTRQAASLDETERKRLFNDAQRVFAAHEPMIYFAAPRIYAAASARVLNISPALRNNRRPQLLWSPDIVALRK
jgi:peptide/nickel transport system substrate-binding protein